MNFRQIEAFHAVMLGGTMTRAAEILHISQPAISRLIDQLEHSTRLRLFERGKGRVTPTAEGVAFYAEVRKSFAGLERLRFAAENIRSLSGGSLRIVTMPALGYAHIPRAIGVFAQSHPDMTVVLQVRNSEAVKEMIASGEADIGYAADEIETAGVEAEIVAEVDAVALLPADHRLAGREALGPEDFDGERYVSLSLGDAARTRIDALFDRHGVRRVLAVETQYSMTCCNLVRSGVGITLVNPLALDGLSREGIVARPFLPRVVFRSLRLLPPGGRNSLAIEAFDRIAREVIDKAAAS